ncbi:MULTISPECIES: hypothetical protein [Actinomadura]|uniref:hypothetical protein n=1 Tax=Actinomadura TaxID=1988 RepID=UPI001486B7A5|nr:hypothetical protein [Actinomadura geliboluensis]
MTAIGSLPQESLCSGTFEVEGVDFDVRTETLRALIVQPGACNVVTTVYEYKLAGA